MYSKFTLKNIILSTLIAMMVGITSSCAREEDQFYDTQLFAFGTLIEITLGNISEEKATVLFQELNAELQNLHTRWHAWSSDSIITQINNACVTHTTLPVDNETQSLIHTGQRLEKNSLGLFNPAMGELIALWGFLTDDPAHPRTPPSSEKIQSILAKHPSLKDIAITQNTLLCQNPNVRLDFGAFGKGYGIEVLMRYLAQHNVTDALINAGGDLKVMGKSDHRAWRVAIRSPFRPKPVGYVALQHNESIMTSGTYERQFVHNEQQYHHIIDPRTGYPAQGFVSVTVVHPDATVADAAATALLIAGPSQWQEIAKSLNITTALFIDPKGNLIMTPDMERRIEYDLEAKKQRSQ